MARTRKRYRLVRVRGEWTQHTAQYHGEYVVCYNIDIYNMYIIMYVQSDHLIVN